MWWARLLIANWTAGTVEPIILAAPFGLTHLRCRHRSRTGLGRAADFATAEVNANPDGPPGLPIDLRWVTLPYLGIPRQPFEVYRRARIISPQRILELTSAAVLVNGSSIIPFQRQARVHLHCGVRSFAELGQRADHGAVRHVRKTFRGCSGSRLHATLVFHLPGYGWVTRGWLWHISVVVGVNRRPTRTCRMGAHPVVGLPVETRIILRRLQQLDEAGFDIALTTGILAARQRMALSHFVSEAAACNGRPNLSLPAWPLQTLRNIYSICARNQFVSHDCEVPAELNDSNPTQMQSLYMETVNISTGSSRPMRRRVRTNPAGQSGSAEFL